MNPNVRDPVNRILGDVPNVQLTPPLEYECVPGSCSRHEFLEQHPTRSKTGRGLLEETSNAFRSRGRECGAFGIEIQIVCRGGISARKSRTSPGGNHRWHRH